MQRVAPVLMALAAAAPVAAQAPPSGQPLPELAADLAYGFCPQLMSGESALASNEVLMSRGFGAKPEAGRNARFPEFALLGQTRSDGAITVGGIDKSICQVTVTGPQAAAALAAMRGSLSELGQQFEADPANSGAGPQGNGSVETLKFAVPGGGVVRVQFLQASVSNDTPLASYQIMFQEQ